MSQLTERALEHSLRKLLAAKPIDRITIGDLTEDCGISRSTFYYHYSDIYELVEDTALREFSEALGSARTHDSWPEGLRNIMRGMDADRAFITNVYDSIDREKLRGVLSAWAEELLYGVVCEESAGLEVTDVQRRTVAHLYQFVFVGVMLDWLDSGMVRDIDAIVDDLAATLEGSFRSALTHLERRGTDSDNPPRLS